MRQYARQYEAIATGARIKRFRRNLHLSQEQVAKQLGVSQRHISSLEMGDFRTLNMELLGDLATVLGTQVEVLLYGEQATSVGARS